MSEELDHCTTGPGAGGDSHFGLRVGSIFIIGVGSLGGALFPVLARRSKHLKVPPKVFDFAKYFGSGVIIATAFIHLLAPALEALGSECLAEGWQDYPYALALAMLSIFSIFIIEIVAFRWGTAKLKKLGITHDQHGHTIGGQHAAHGPEDPEAPMPHAPVGKDEASSVSSQNDDLSLPRHSLGTSPATQIIGIAILEFGVILHSVLIGLTLAVDPDFVVLFVVLVFHQTFEGLGVGSRLAFLPLPDNFRHVPVLAAIIYGLSTPIGIAIGLGVRQTYNPESTTASIVSGTMDSISAGILLYTGLVELLAHEFLFNKAMIEGSNGKLAYAICSMLLGCALMALLGRWA